MKTILVAVDPQHDADRVLARAAQLSEQHKAAVVVMHVLDDMGVMEPEMRAAAGRHARATLETLIDAPRFAGAPTLRVEFGIPHRCVTKAAHELSADIVVIGPGQPSTLLQRVFGSTADRIVRMASVPVLVVRGEHARRYGTVAAAMDFSPLSEAALEAVRGLAPDARITLVHAYEAPLPFEQAMLRAGTLPDDAEHFRRSRMNDCRRQLLDLARPHGREENVLVLQGAPGAALVELSQGGRVDLVAMGTQGRNATAEVLLGSVARRLLSEAGCDVLVVGPARV